MRAGHAAGLLCATLVAVGMSVSSNAYGYCQATTCKQNDACNGQTVPGCMPLKWNRDCIGFALQANGSSEISLDVARNAMRTAFATWQQADCGSGLPGILVQDMGTVTCDKVEFNPTAGNINVVVFRDTEWPHVDGTHNLALTTVSYEAETGQIFNADIEVNTNGYDFSDAGQYDLLSVFTHEAGHFLGLSHSGIEEATMYFMYSDYSTAFQTLALDDMEGICSIYPPRNIDPNRCNPIPRHGFASECGADQTEGCGVSQGQRANAPLSLAFVATLIIARRLRRHRPKRIPAVPRMPVSDRPT